MSGLGVGLVGSVGWVGGTVLAQEKGSGTENLAHRQGRHGIFGVCSSVGEN